jgi:hypothetical protein
MNKNEFEDSITGEEDLVVASEDWESTCIIYGVDDDDDRGSSSKSKTSTILDNKGHLLKGSIDTSVNLANLTFCREMSNQEYRFWLTAEPSLTFRITFFGNRSSDEDVYLHNEDGLSIDIVSTYPHSFPPQETWLTWVNEQAQTLFKEERLSYSVCDFVEHRALEYFEMLYDTEDHTLMLCQDAGPTFYDTPTILVDPRRHAWQSLMQRQHTNNTKQHIPDVYHLTPNEYKYILPILLHSDDWLVVTCPICFDTVAPKEAKKITPCGHSFCEECISFYLQMKAEEIVEQRFNPFTCPVPECRRGILIIGCVKTFLPPKTMDKVRLWIKNVKNPPCYALPTCPKQSCDGVMRKDQVDSHFIFCDECQGRWCELCLKRLKVEHNEEECHRNTALCVHFCERYTAASDQAKARCEAKWPWIKVYAKSINHDYSTRKWIESNGQVCPGCKMGVERTEGCFHMQCQNCQTHFCYECGTQLYAPFYGTHHCWEENDHNNNQINHHDDNFAFAFY